MSRGNRWPDPKTAVASFGIGPRLNSREWRAYCPDHPGRGHPAIPRKSRRDENVEATRAALVAVARRQFARKGFGGTDLADIARDARLTTGAIYHHFKNKLALFQAVAEGLEGEILAAATSAPAADPWEAMHAAF